MSPRLRRITINWPLEIDCSSEAEARTEVKAWEDLGYKAKLIEVLEGGEVTGTTPDGLPIIEGQRTWKVRVEP